MGAVWLLQRSGPGETMMHLQFIRSWLAAERPRGATAALYVGLAVAVPTAIRASIDGLVTGTTFVAYFPFIMLAAMFLGWRHAAVVGLVAALVANFLFMEPRYTFFASSQDTTGAMSFVLSSFMVILLVETLRSTVQELEASRRHQAHLNLELQHRVKNTMAVIQGLATQTFRSASAEGDLRLFQGRLQALGSAHDILGTGRWKTCRLPELALRALEPFNRAGAVNLYGPPCTLNEASCVPLVLALHELATNAVKYGALSNSAGSVDVVWTLSHPAGPEQQLTLEWIERDGPPVQVPSKRGLGSRLLRAQPGIKDVALAFSPQGVTCRFLITGAKVAARSADNPVIGAPATVYSTEAPVRDTAG